MTFTAQDIGEIDDQNAIRYHHALQHNDSHKRLNIERGAGQHEGEDDADNAGWNGEHDEEGVDERFELSNQDEIHEHDGQKGPTPKLLKDWFMVTTSPRTLIRILGGSVVLAMILEIAVFSLPKSSPSGAT